MKRSNCYDGQFIRRAGTAMSGKVEVRMEVISVGRIKATVLMPNGKKRTILFKRIEPYCGK